MYFVYCGKRQGRRQIPNNKANLTLFKVARKRSSKRGDLQTIPDKGHEFSGSLNFKNQNLTDIPSENAYRRVNILP